LSNIFGKNDKNEIKKQVVVRFNPPLSLAFSQIFLAPGRRYYFGADFTFLSKLHFRNCRFRWSLFDKSEKSLAESLSYVLEVHYFSFFVSRARLFGKTQKY